MQIELAPMEGITTYIYRNALNKFYGGVDTYFSPFISTHKNKSLNYKELNDINPENNNDINLIPQILTSDAEDFSNTVAQIAQMGYQEVNLNFGCPSGTVTAKGKGSGMLLEPEKLERLLDNIFSKNDIKISVKTRLGYSDYDEWPRLLRIYSKFPISELIIHGRVREDFYNNNSRIDVIRDNVEFIPKDFKVSYNGDIDSRDSFLNMSSILPDIHACMLGRGIIARPFLAKEIKNSANEVLEEDTFKAFNIELMEKYARIMSGDRNTLFKLKELWVYMARNFEDSQKLLKKVRKINNLREYESFIIGGRV